MHGFSEIWSAGAVEYWKKREKPTLQYSITPTPSILEASKEGAPEPTAACDD
jgi:hypothetical protein